MSNLITKFLESEDGATAIEYAMLLVIMALGIITNLAQIAPALNGHWNQVTSNLN